MSKFIIRTVASGVKFDLNAANGETVATSEVYTTENACRNGIASVRKNAPTAGIEDQTMQNTKKTGCPKFEIYADRSGQFRFRLRARNGQIIAASESYSSKSGCLSGIESVRKNAMSGDIERAERI